MGWLLASRAADLMLPRPMSKSLDLVVYGATGFTGHLAVLYLAEHAPKSLTWAIAGRDRQKLEVIRDEVRARFDREVEVLVARSDDRASLDAMTSEARVVLTTVGPYAQHGEPLVASCVEQRADYVDITGEPEFVDRVLEVYGERAAEAGVRIVSCCGFDSIPHDLGAYFTMRELAPKGPVTMEGFVQAGGGISGGTWHSAVGAMSRLSEQRKAARLRPKQVASGGRSVRGLAPKPRKEPEVRGWVLPMPTIDPQIVLRSARSLDFYGPDFRYGHYVRVGSLAKAAALVAGVGAVAALSQLGPTRELLLKAKRQGEGPSEEVRRNGYFRVTFIARSGGEKLVTRVSGGEPGYAETSKMISESALALVFDRERLPKTVGVLTTAEAMGDVLLERLIAAGIRFEVVERSRER
jgi:short subunit dehydrogenase-like uncharacterized protein